MAAHLNSKDLHIELSGWLFHQHQILCISAQASFQAPSKSAETGKKRRPHSCLMCAPVVEATLVDNLAPADGALAVATFDGSVMKMDDASKMEELWPR